MERERKKRKEELSEVSPDSSQISLVNGFVSHTNYGKTKRGITDSRAGTNTTGLHP